MPANDSSPEVDQPARLPSTLFTLLDGSEIADRVGLTIELLTVDSDGWPRVALLSAGEVLALSPSVIRLALWPATQSTSNLTRSGQGSLALVHAGAAYAIRLSTRRIADLADPVLAAFEGAVASVRRDEVAYARLRAGITFELPDPEPVVARWQATVAELRAHPGLQARAAG